LPWLPGYRFFILALRRSGIWQRLVYSNWLLGWFEEFNTYWTKRLGLRPLHPPDFWFLYGVYRQRFQTLRLPEHEDSEAHLRAWQEPRTIYLLFSNQLKIALNPLAAYRFMRYVRNNAILEYGAGLAPIATSIVRYWPRFKGHITLADIATIVRDFCQWRLAGCPNVSFLELSTDCQTGLPEARYHVVFCQAVLEHVLDPLAVVQSLHRALKPRGYLVLDYIRSEGTGLDSRASLGFRGDVIAFLEQNFKVIEGRLPRNPEESIGTVVLKK
jgi:SAM-dependent methyltransferase